MRQLAWSTSITKFRKVLTSSHQTPFKLNSEASIMTKILKKEKMNSESKVRTDSVCHHLFTENSSGHKHTLFNPEISEELSSRQSKKTQRVSITDLSAMSEWKKYFSQIDDFKIHRFKHASSEIIRQNQSSSSDDQIVKSLK